jgi:hypothetical protein
MCQTSYSAILILESFEDVGNINNFDAKNINYIFWNKYAWKLDALPTWCKSIIVSDGHITPYGKFIYYLTTQWEKIELKPKIFNDLQMIKYPNNIECIFVSSFQYASVDAFKFPDYVTKIIFNNRFNQNIDKLPQSLIHLKFGNNFNMGVDNLPPNIQYITFGEKFNMSVDNLPQNIVSLSFGNRFNKPINNLPFALEHIEFGTDFQQSTDLLPQKIDNILFGGIVPQLENLPYSVKTIDVNTSYGDTFCNINFIPFHIKLIKLCPVREFNLERIKNLMKNGKITVQMEEIYDGCTFDVAYIAGNIDYKLKNYFSVKKYLSDMIKLMSVDTTKSTTNQNCGK